MWKATFLLLVLDVQRLMTAPSLDEEPVDPGNAVRLSPLASEVVNVSDVQELRERTIANVSHSLSNTSLSDLESDNLTQLLLIKYRERKRQERLIAIQAQILQGLRMNRKPNISGNFFSEDDQRRLNVIVRRVHYFNNKHHADDNASGSEGNPAATQHTTIQRLQSFYPSCSLPNNTDKSTWDNPQAFRIFYELPISRYSFGAQVAVLLAKLRLYKKTLSDGWDFNLTEMQRYNMLDAMMEGLTGAINVSIYQFTKPVRHNRKEKKRLVDTRTVILDHEGWVEFNVVSSLNYWFQHSHKNYGFDVEIEDATGNKLDPNVFFRNVNCSSTETMTQDPPFPNIMELHPEMMGENESSLFDNETIPTLDLQTADFSPAADFPLFPASPFFGAIQPNSKRLLRKRHLHLHRDTTVECAPERTYYSFHELGLDDVVVHPKGFHWISCEGSCRRPLLQPNRSSTHQPSNTATKSRFFHRLSTLWDMIFKYSPSVSHCIASGKKPLHVIYLNESNSVEEVTFEEFIPTECSCGES